MTWTIGQLLTWTADFLGKKGAETPRLDAEVLLANVLQCDRVRLYTGYDQEVGEQDRAAYRESIRRRAEGTPVAYLVGRKEFFSLALKVGPAVLIPRPDTETVVVEFLERFKNVAEVRAVDVGTGSGCIAIACASRHKEARFVATDRSVEALEIARENARTHGLTDRIDFVPGDLLDPVKDRGPWDAILSNPPYIPTEVIPQLATGVRDHEPHMALDGGADGLRVVARLIAQATPLLKPGGHLILEIGTDQEGPVRDLLRQRDELELAPTIKDAANNPRVLRATRTA